jgi:dolichol-phosphate mannosyltransferase
MIFLLLPAFNEEKSIKNLFENLAGYVKSSGLEISVVLLDDGSVDKTAETARSMSDRLRLTVLQHTINRGLGETSRDLFEYAAQAALPEDIIIRMDCDDTQDPAVIQTMAEKITRGGFDVVVASRFRKGGGMSGVNAYRSFMSYAANLFMKLVFPMKGVRDYSSGFRAYRASVVRDALRVFGNNFIQLKGMGFTGTLEKLIKLNMLGAKFTEVGHFLHYDRKRSPSKMISSITAFGYLVMAVLYHWPFGGWKSQYRGLARSYRGDRKLFDRLVQKRLRRFHVLTP